MERHLLRHRRHCRHVWLLLDIMLLMLLRRLLLRLLHGLHHGPLLLLLLHRLLPLSLP